MTTTSEQTPMVHELARIYGFNASEALHKLGLLRTDTADLSPGDQHEADAMNVAVELSGREEVQRIYEHEDAQVVFGNAQRQGSWSSEEQQETALKAALKATVHRRPTLSATQKAAARIGRQAIRALVKAAKAAEKAQKAAEKAQKAAERENKARERAAEKAQKAAEKARKAAQRAAEKQKKAAVRIGKQAIRALVKAAKRAERAQKAAEKEKKAAEKERKAAEKERKAAEAHAQC